MPSDERTLLHNLLDSLDRLYDLRSRLPPEEEYRKALVVTNDLRLKLANYYE